MRLRATVAIAQNVPIRSYLQVDEIKCNLTCSLSAGEVSPNNVAKVTHLGEGIQVYNTYYEGRLSNYEANYASSC
ncbi:hypothetical protein [uncultured Nostoc sp.]|uniref:hypothetical protein n=1 Tax=uncultured Nostoc sp. TaxID=340711 RepID=UPI0035CB599A